MKWNLKWLKENYFNFENWYHSIIVKLEYLITIFLVVVLKILEFVFGIISPVYIKILKGYKEFKNDYRNVSNFFVLILTFPLIILIIWYCMKDVAMATSELSYKDVEAIVRLVVFVIYVITICHIIQEERRYKCDEKLKMNHIYYIFALFHFFSVIVSFSRGTYISLIVKNSSAYKTLINYISVDSNLINLFWISFISLKEAILSAIIFDAAYQHYKFSRGKSLREYYKKLIENGRIYILDSEKDMDSPRLWIIRGDACADIIDDFEKLGIKSSFDTKIKLDQSLSKKIIDKRKQLGFDDTDTCMGSEDDYYFCFREFIMDGVYTEDFKQNELMSMVKNGAVVLPIEAELSNYQILRVVERITGWLSKRSKIIKLVYFQ